MPMKSGCSLCYFALRSCLFVAHIQMQIWICKFQKSYTHNCYIIPTRNYFKTVILLKGLKKT